MSAFDAVDLGRLPPPDVIEALDFEAALAALQADFIARWPQFDALVESDPIVKLLEVAAFRETLLRARVNDAARAVMLASATGADLDHLAALLSVGRLTIDPGDPDASPPVAPTLETDTALRRRVQLALEAATAAGTVGRYLFFALGADPRVADAAITSPIPGDVLVTILSREGDGVPDAGLLTAVTIALTDPEVRQLNDTVFVGAAAVIDVPIAAELTIQPGPGSEATLAAASAAAAALTTGDRRLGRSLYRSAIIAALHVEGVDHVVLTAPAVDVAATPLQAPRVTTVTLTEAP